MHRGRLETDSPSSAPSACSLRLVSLRRVQYPYQRLQVVTTKDAFNDLIRLKVARLSRAQRNFVATALELLQGTINPRFHQRGDECSSRCTERRPHRPA